MSGPKNDIGESLALLFLATCAGGGLAFLGYIAIALFLETNVIPQLEPPIFSYGQQFGMISLPLSTLIGMLSGFVFGFYNKRRRRRVALALIAISIVSSFVTLDLWRGDGIGVCNSAIVLYYPIFGLCVVVGTFGLSLFVASTFRRDAELANNNMHVLTRNGRFTSGRDSHGSNC